MCRIDMNALAQEHYAASLAGAASGLLRQQGIAHLVRPVNHRGCATSTASGFRPRRTSPRQWDPYTPGIVLFDEVEKADPTVQQRISFRSCLVFLTSNLGSKEVAEAQRRQQRCGRAKGTRSSIAHTPVIQKALEAFVDPEFFNRLDETVIFNALDGQTALAVTRRDGDDLRTRLRRRGIDLTVDGTAIEYLTRRGFDGVYGARGLRRITRTCLAEPVAREVLQRRGHYRADPLVVHA